MSRSYKKSPCYLWKSRSQKVRRFDKRYANVLVRRGNTLMQHHAYRRLYERCHICDCRLRSSLSEYLAGMDYEGEAGKRKMIMEWKKSYYRK